MAGFQSTIYPVQGLGVPGDPWASTPRRAQSYILQSVSADYNIVGQTMFCNVTQGIALAGGDEKTRGFAGLLVNSKAYASYGTSGGGPLAPTMTLANNVQAELATMGTYIVYLPGAANIGDPVIYDQTTGAISTVSLGTSLPTGKSWGFAFVDYFTVGGAGLAVITLNPGASYPPV